MIDIKHSKYRNTMFLYLILMNRVTNIIIEGKENKLSLIKNIISKFFKQNSLINKLLNLYKNIILDKKPLREVINNYKIKINTKKLLKLKYNLVRLILESFPDFKLYIKLTTVPNYKLYASIYKLFTHYSDKNIEYKTLDNILSQLKLLVLLYKNKDIIDYSMKKFLLADNNVKILIYKLVLLKFNKKYLNMLPSQKKLLYYYLNNNTYNIMKMANKLYLKFNVLLLCDNQVIKLKVELVVKKLKLVLSHKVTKINLNHLKFLLLYLDLLHLIKLLK